MSKMSHAAYTRQSDDVMIRKISFHGVFMMKSPREATPEPPYFSLNFSDHLSFCQKRVDMNMTCRDDLMIRHNDHKLTFYGNFGEIYAVTDIQYAEVWVEKFAIYRNLFQLYTTVDDQTDLVSDIVMTMYSMIDMSLRRWSKFSHQFKTKFIVTTRSLSRWHTITSSVTSCHDMRMRYLTSSAGRTMMTSYLVRSPNHDVAVRT